MHKEEPVCCTGQEERLHLQLPLLLSVELWAETSCSRLGSCGPCCHSGDLCSSLVQVRQEHVVCSVRQAESPAQSPTMGKGSQSVSFSEGFSRAAGHGVAYPPAGLPREAGQHIHSRPRTVLVFREGENHHCFLLLCALWYSREQTLTHRVVFVLQTFCYSCTWVFKTSLQQQNQVGKQKPLQESWALKLIKQSRLRIKWKTDCTS